VCIADFGLVPLAWLPGGQPAGPLNPRYAAPELFERGGGPAADQFSLALVYAELLSGVHARPMRGSAPGSGVFRQVPRPATPGSRPSGVRKGPARIDLDLLPTADRPILSRALSDNPRQRFPNCTELVDALEAATPGREEAAALYHTLPPVIPFTSLLGQPVPPNLVLPSLRQVVGALAVPPAEALAALAEDEGPAVRAGHHLRYTVLPGGVWEYQCPIQVVPGTTRLKLDGFRRQWKARLVREEGERYLFHIDLPVARRVLEVLAARPPRLEVQVQVRAPRQAGRCLSEARVLMRPVGGRPGEVDRVLTSMGPRVFESLRLFLQAAPEQRGCDRWPCLLPLRVYPVRPDLELGEVLDAVGRNVSFSGISFRAPRVPAAEKLYLQWPGSPTAAGVAVLVSVVRVQETAPGICDVGAVFAGQPPEAARALDEAWDDWK
jgi:hypothetical protein